MKFEIKHKLNWCMKYFEKGNQVVGEKDLTELGLANESKQTGDNK